MKTLYKTYTEQQAKEKCKEYEAQTGVKWQCYHTGDGYRLTAIITRETPTDEALANRLLPFVTRDAYSFAALADKSGMTLPEVLIAAKTLAKAGKTSADVNRMGGWAAIHKFWNK